MADPFFKKGIESWYGDPAEHAIWAKTRVAAGLSPTERRLFDKCLSVPGRVLNVGCGGGREAIALAKMGCEVVAVDLLPAFVDAARKNAEAAGASATFATGDVTELAYADASFDAVVMVGQMIGQVPTRAGRLRALAECRRVLNDGGVLVASTNAIELHWKYGLFFRVVNACRKIYNPHGLEPGDAFAFRTGGRWRPLVPKSRRSVYHWYTRAEFIADLDAAGFACTESIRRSEAETDGRGRPLMNGETFYVAIKR